MRRAFGALITITTILVFVAGVHAPTASAASTANVVAAAPFPTATAPTSSASAPKPAPSAPASVTVTVTTVPAVPGLSLRFDGITATTNASGTAAFTTERNRDSHTLSVIDTERELGDTRYVFERWSGEKDFSQAFASTLDNVTSRTSNTLTAVFAVQRAVSPVFVDQLGAPVDRNRIAAATARSSDGASVAISPTEKTWLESTQVVSRSGTDLEVENLSYSWQTVIVNGTNIVDSGRQSFVPATTAAPMVQGQFHNLTVTAQDALFGSPAGTEVVLTYPDGSTITAPMGESRTAVFSDLPRGSYQATVHAGPAIVNTQHVRLSRDITVEVPVISVLDIVLIVGALALMSIALLFIGRKTLRRRVLTPLSGVRAVKVPSA